MLFTFSYGGRGALINYLVKKSPPSQVKVYWLPNSLFHITFLDPWKIYINIPLFCQSGSTFVGHFVDILVFYSNQKVWKYPDAVEKDIVTINFLF